MSLEFASKDGIWCVMFVDACGRTTKHVLFFSIFKSQCVQYMEQRGYTS
jgi:hypothetical protein